MPKEATVGRIRSRLFVLILLPGMFCVLTSVALAAPAPAPSAPAAASPSSPGPAAVPEPAPVGNSPSHKSGSATTAEENAASIARLTQSNQDLLDLLKKQHQDLLDLLDKQQAVLVDIQFDRRLQNRQISSLEERLEETMQQNSQLEAKVARLEAQIAVTPVPTAPPPGSTAAPATSPARTDSASASDQPPAPPASYLPAPDSEGAPGTKSWHRLFTLSGTDGKNSDPFHIDGSQWRVLWHNQDRPGAAYANTSALFINAFAKNDTVPQKVCSKLGSGGDSTELTGPGNYFLKVEASGGAWELAVEDFK